MLTAADLQVISGLTFLGGLPTKIPFDLSFNSVLMVGELRVMTGPTFLGGLPTGSACTCRNLTKILFDCSFNSMLLVQGLLVTLIRAQLINLLLTTRSLQLKTCVVICSRSGFLMKGTICFN